MDEPHHHHRREELLIVLKVSPPTPATITGTIILWEQCFFQHVRIFQTKTIRWSWRGKTYYLKTKYTNVFKKIPYVMEKTNFVEHLLRSRLVRSKYTKRYTNPLIKQRHTVLYLVAPCYQFCCEFTRLVENRILWRPSIFKTFSFRRRRSAQSSLLTSE